MIVELVDPSKKLMFDTFKLFRIDFEELLIDAQRYAIGRMTYTPQMVCKIINENVSELSDNTLIVIIKDIVSNINRGNYGSEIVDLPYWIETCKIITRELSKREIEILKEYKINIVKKLS